MAFDAYIKFMDKGGQHIKGEATDDKHKEWCEVLSLSWGMSNPATIGAGTKGASTGRASISSLNLMKRTDKCSAVLATKLVTGEHLKEVHLELCKSTGKKEPYIIYKLTQAYVDSQQWSASSGGDDYPTESLSIAFAKVEWEYWEQGADGSLKKAGQMAWDQTTAKA